MQISTDVFEGIIGHPNVNFDTDGTRRLSSRVAVSKRATLSPTGSTDRIPMTIVDVSVGGVGFIYSTPLTPGEEFILRVTGRSGNSLVVECTVRWCKTTCSGRCRIGAEFMRLIDEENELEQLDRMCAAGSTSPHR